VGQVTDIERRHVMPGSDGTQPAIRVDLRALKLREDLMERNGLLITERPEVRQLYEDGSEQLPRPLRYFDNTATPQGTEHSHEYVPVQPVNTGGQAAPDRERAPSEAQTGQNNQRERDSGYGFRLNPNLQRIIDAGKTGDPDKINAAMRESAEAYLASPQGQAFTMRSQARAQEMLEQQQEAQQQAMQQPAMRMSR
jgi:hypothetical protein